MFDHFSIHICCLLAVCLLVHGKYSWTAWDDWLPDPRGRWTLWQSCSDWNTTIQNQILWLWFCDSEFGPRILYSGFPLHTEWKGMCKIVFWVWVKRELEFNYIWSLFRFDASIVNLCASNLGYLNVCVAPNPAPDRAKQHHLEQMHQEHFRSVVRTILSARWLPNHHHHPIIITRATHYPDAVIRHWTLAEHCPGISPIVII